MKEIAIVITKISFSGVGKCLTEFVKKIDNQKYNITILTEDVENVFINMLPNYVKIIDLKSGSDTNRILVRDLKNFRIHSVIGGLVKRIKIRLTKDTYRQQAYSEQLKRKIEKQYDCAIAYRLEHMDVACVCNRINAKKLCAFVHGLDKNDTYKYESSLYYSLDEIDKIFCVSNGLKDEFIDIEPHLAEKVDVMHNFYDIEEILRKSNEKAEDSIFESIAVVTVGRIASEKGQIMVPKICRKLLDENYDIKWYLVGDGPSLEELEKEIVKFGVEENVIILGKKLNPYPYIKNCTIYVQPSYREGYCTTTMEAKILHKPIVTTDVSGMREQFVSGENGLIVDVSVEGLYSGIKELLDNPELREKFIKKLETEKIDNIEELKKLYDFIEL